MSAQESDGAARTVARTLAAHGVAATVADTLEGPSTYTLVLELAAGTRPEELDRLTRSLAVALEVDAVRVTARGGRLALEVPRADRQPVYLEDVAPPTNAPPLSWPIGSATDGTPVLADLTRAPHVLIAGTTGSGKSTAVNALLTTLTTRATAREVRLLLVDVKRVELSGYRDCPHLAAPIATDVEEAREVLGYAVAEMEARYEAMASVGARTLEETTAPFARLVVVIDELADLMLTARKSVEPLIVRLAQLGRAAGIHLVLATQRPSADVLTGLIRANIPTRLALTTQSHTDSLIALGQTGAETLTGAGDALWLPSGTRRPVRVQVPLVNAPAAAAAPQPTVEQPAPAPQQSAPITYAPDGAPMIPSDRICYICGRHRAFPGTLVCLAPDCTGTDWQAVKAATDVVPASVASVVGTLSPWQRWRHGRRAARFAHHLSASR